MLDRSIVADAAEHGKCLAGCGNIPGPDSGDQFFIDLFACGRLDRGSGNTSLGQRDREFSAVVLVDRSFEISAIDKRSRPTPAGGLFRDTQFSDKLPERYLTGAQCEKPPMTYRPLPGISSKPAASRACRIRIP